jgi:hypothetical protein
MNCQLPEQTSSYGFCLNDDIIMEGVSAVTPTRGYQTIDQWSQCNAHISPLFRQVDSSIKPVDKNPYGISESTLDDYYQLYKIKNP